jgi:radical SAM superfamily enzyme YgiQ (UPF0313 family)
MTARRRNDAVPRAPSRRSDRDRVTPKALLAREVGAIRKPHGGRLRVALAFPNTYHVGMSNLGFQTVYRLFNADERVVCERVFLPPRQEVATMAAHRRALLTLESGTPVRDFDAFAFSVSFEWDYANVVSMLRLAGLEPRAGRRHARDPLVIVGGAVTFVNPEPLAPFADVIAAGEGEVLVPALVEGFADTRPGDREGLLNRLAVGRGFYVPSFYDVTYAGPGRVAAITPRTDSQAPVTVRKAAVRATDDLDPPATQIFTPDTEFGSRLLVEVVRGCANLCRFCWAGYNYLPVRAFPASRILDLAAAARSHATRVGLVSIALCDHPEIERILERLVDMGYGISPASLRLDDLTRPIIRLLRESGERSVTIAPETGSDRLRRVINKTVTNEQILDRAGLIFDAGIENLKLYYMIALPTETDDDLVAIRDVTMAIRDRMVVSARPRGRLGRLVASVNPLVPKPGTTYQRRGSVACALWSPGSTTSTSTSSPNGIPSTRVCSRSVIVVWPTSSNSSRKTAGTGVVRSPSQGWMVTRTSIVTGERMRSCHGRSSTAASRRPSSGANSRRANAPSGPCR